MNTDNPTPHPDPLPIGSADSANAEREKTLTRERLARAGGGDIGEPRPECFFTARSRRALRCVSGICLDQDGPSLIVTAVSIRGFQLWEYGHN